MWRRGVFTFLGVLLIAGSAEAVDPAVKCNASKVKEAAKYSACRLKAESKAIKKGEAPDYSKCDTKFSEKWQKAESQAGGACPTLGDEAPIMDQVIADAGTIVARLSGVRFVDNEDGTITDNQRGLMWEQKVLGAGCLHCVEDSYNWTDAMSEWISEVNGHTDDPGAQSGLGEHTDWRLATIAEFQTIVDCGFGPPCIDPIFGPSGPFGHWSSTTLLDPVSAWAVGFNDGGVAGRNKAGNRTVRAVRVGLTGLSTGVRAVDADSKCYADKLKEAAKYSACRLKAESKAIKKGEAPDYSKCDTKFSEKWQKAESRAGGACPTLGDEGPIKDQVATDSDTIVVRLSGVRFVDNGDGTITDNQTGLMWEMKVPGAGCLHCVDDTYDWFDAMSEWISEVNGHTDDPDAQSGLGDHSDWRLPNVVELQTIVDCSFGPPCIDPIFGSTALSIYWSSTTSASGPGSAWLVSFNSGLVFFESKLDDFPVRAVRGGL
jgi:hypothetical protein